MGKGAKEGKDDTMNDSQTEAGPSYEEKLKFVSCIAKPMASKKLTKKLLLKLSINLRLFWKEMRLLSFWSPLSLQDSLEVDELETSRGGFSSCIS